MQKPDAMTPEAIWLFDSVCVLCSRGVQYTLRHEKAASIRFVAIQSEEGQAIAYSCGVDPDDPATFLFIEDGVALDKSDAVIALVGHLNGPARIVRMIRFIPRSWRDWAYGFVARNRYRLFGKAKSCIAPDGTQRHRFVL